MTFRPGLSLRQWLMAVVYLGIGGALAGLAVAVVGFYDVAASRGHYSWVDRLLEISLARSVAFHAAGIDAPALDAPGQVALGAAHFDIACAPCHGAPGVAQSPVFAAMLPSPPNLQEEIDDWTAEEAYRIVLHGIKFAGMPAWPGEGRDDEVWALVAFLEALPDLDPSAYAALADRNALRRSNDSAAANPNEVCARCHDTPDASPVSPLVPTLGGQSAAYLGQALRDYRSGARESGYMETVAAALGDADIAALAERYAALDSPAAGDTAPSAPHDAGRLLAVDGDPANDVPDCESCHGPRRKSEYPGLAGQSVVYQTAQLRLWRAGGRTGTEPGRTMADIADRLSDEQIDAVSRYYASLPRRAGGGSP